MANQVLPEDSTGLSEAYLDATKSTHVYLLLDLTQDLKTDTGFEPTSSSMNILLSSMLRYMMKRIKANCHTLHVLKTQNQKRTAVISEGG